MINEKISLLKSDLKIKKTDIQIISSNLPQIGLISIKIFRN